MELIKIDYKEFGLAEQKALEIEKAFTPMVEAMTELEPEYNQLMARCKGPITEGVPSDGLIEEATEMLKKYVKIRTSTSNAHKEEKAVFRKAGLFIDGLKNGQLQASTPREDALRGIKDHFVDIEKARLADLQLEREEAIKPFLGEFESVQSYSGIPDAQWEALLADKKLTCQAKLDLIEKQKKDTEDERLENERIREENAKLIEKNKKLEALTLSTTTVEEMDKNATSPNNPFYLAGIKDIYDMANNCHYEEFKEWYIKIKN